MKSHLHIVTQEGDECSNVFNFHAATPREPIRDSVGVLLICSGCMTLDELRIAAIDALGVTPDRPLATGGQKVVYLVNRDDASLVMKLMQIGSADPTALERARREFDTLAGAHHPNLVRVESDLVTIGSPVEGVAWLEERLDGVDVLSLLGAQWEEGDVIRLGLDVSGATGALHNLSIVHRDLSAGNVRRLQGGGFKVMDPGFAKHTLRTGITVGGQPGTRGFMTPEHVQAYTGPTPASDVYAIGNLMYAAATGTLPFPYAGDDGEYIARLTLGRFTPVADLRPDLSPELVEIIQRALHPHPARRYRNGDQLQSRIGGI